MKFLSTFNGRSSQEDPLKVFRFLVEIDNFARAGFKIANIPTATVGIDEYREGGDNTTVRKSPGLTTFSDIVLERGVILAAGSGDLDCYNWFRQVFDISARGPRANKNFRRTVDIVELDREGLEARRYRVQQAWPMSFKPATDKDGTATGDSVESMTLTHEGFYLVGA